ncbi:hypothetical protein DPEC_G00354160 [Dallia pectoralis]|uniref:Uncharacterized protein n=1 Tax=Dallia pectoralis TaxID=75939 RepID=A0ACC2F2X5_DALPE|nr:hypothetical protein DPEC_G00354160 [Dallia pectoralis]
MSLVCGLSIRDVIGVWAVHQRCHWCVGCPSEMSLVCGLSIRDVIGVWAVHQRCHWCVGCPSEMSLVCGLSIRDVIGVWAVHQRCHWCVGCQSFLRIARNEVHVQTAANVSEFEIVLSMMMSGEMSEASESTGDTVGSSSSDADQQNITSKNC